MDMIGLSKDEFKEVGVDISNFTRKPLAPGNIYSQCKKPSMKSFEIVSMSLPGTDSDDGMLPGVSVKFFDHKAKKRSTAWYPIKTEEEFWKHCYFCYGVD